MRLALHNSIRSIPLQIVAVVVMVLMGAAVGKYVGAVATAALGLGVAFWRIVISRKFSGPDRVLSEEELKSAEHHLEWNALLAGAMWLVSSFGIFAYLDGWMEKAYIFFACGSIAVAALFMALIGRSFLLLAVPELGGIIAVTLWTEGLVSLPLAVLIALFGVTMFRASREFCNTTRPRDPAQPRGRPCGSFVEGRQGGGRGRQPREVAVPRDHEPRDPHADERRPRCAGPAAPLAARCRATRAGSDRGLVRHVADEHPQRRARPLEDRGRQDEPHARADLAALAGDTVDGACSRPMRMRRACRCVSSSSPMWSTGSSPTASASSRSPQSGRQCDQVHRERRGRRCA